MRNGLVWSLGVSVAVSLFAGCGDDDTSSSGGSGGASGGRASGGALGANGGAKTGGAPGSGGGGGASGSVSAVGLGYAADEHQRGIAVLNTVGHGQNNDPFFTGQSDWFVIQSCTAYDSGSGDGHGIYLSNGSDWNIARWNETYDTYSSDFQINADPASTCSDEGIAFDDPECDAVAGSHPTGAGRLRLHADRGELFSPQPGAGSKLYFCPQQRRQNNVFALPAAVSAGGQLLATDGSTPPVDLGPFES